MSDHWKDLADKLGTPSLNPLPRKTSAPKQAKAVPPVESPTEAASSVETVVEETVAPAPPPAKRSSWDTLSRLFGIGGSSEPEPAKVTPVSKPEPPRSESPRSESPRQDRSHAEIGFAPVSEPAPVVETSPLDDEIGWQPPPRRRDREEPVKSEVRPSRDSASREPRGRDAARSESRERPEPRDPARSRDAAPRDAAAPRDPAAPRDAAGRGKKDIRPSNDRPAKKTRGPSIWDTPETIDEPLAESSEILEADLEADLGEDEVVSRRGHRRPPRRGHRPRTEEGAAAADVDSPELPLRSEAGRDEPRQQAPRSDRNDGRRPPREPRPENRDQGREGRGEPRSDVRGEARSDVRGEARRDGQRTPRGARPARGDGRPPRSEHARSDSPRPEGGRGDHRSNPRGPAPIDDEIEKDDDVLDTDWNLDTDVDSDVEVEEAPVAEEKPRRRGGRGGRRRGRGGEREQPPRDLDEDAPLVEADPDLDGDEIDHSDPDDEDQIPGSKHVKIPTWSEAIGILVDLNAENHRRHANSPQGNRHRGGGGGRRNESYRSGPDRRSGNRNKPN